MINRHPNPVARPNRPHHPHRPPTLRLQLAALRLRVAHLQLEAAALSARLTRIDPFAAPLPPRPARRTPSSPPSASPRRSVPIVDLGHGWQIEARPDPDTVAAPVHTASVSVRVRPGGVRVLVPTLSISSSSSTLVPGPWSLIPVASPDDDPPDTDERLQSHCLCCRGDLDPRTQICRRCGWSQ